MALHSNAQLHSDTCCYLLKENKTHQQWDHSSTDQPRCWNGNSAGSLMACSEEEEEAPRCKVVACGLNPGHCYEEVGAVEGKRHICQHTNNSTLYWPNYMGGKVIRHDNSMCTSSKWHSSFGTEAWQMRAHTHTNIHAHLFWNTPAERADVWRGFPFVSSPPRRHLMCVSVIYGWCARKAIYSFQSDKEPLCD